MLKLFNKIYNSTIYSIKKSIRAKISAGFISIVVFTVFIIVLISYINVSNIIKKKTIDYISNAMYKSNENLDIILSDLDRINTIISINNPILFELIEEKNEEPTMEWFNNIKTLNNYLISIANSRQNIVRGIAVIGINGEVFQGGDPVIFSDMLNQTWAKKIIEGEGKRVILKRNENEYALNGKYVLTLGRAIIRYGQVEGIVLVDVDFEVINSFFDLNGISREGFFVINNENEIIYKYIDNSNTELIQNIESNMGVYNISNISYMKSEQWFNDRYITIDYKSDYTGWTTIVMISKDYLLKDLVNLKKEIAIIIIPIVILSLLLGFVIANQITKNLKKLMNTMERVKKGNLKATLNINSEDEVGELSKIYIEMMENIHELMENIKHTEKQKRIAELNVLQTQVNPHFLCNTLNTIKYLAQLQNISNIADVTVSLTKLLRISINNKDTLISIREEVELVKSYITIQQYKYLDKFSVVYLIDDEVLEFKTIKMLLQPLVENAIIHGIEQSDNEGIISIKANKKSNSIKFEVLDNGIGMTSDKINNIFLEDSNEKKSRFNGIGIKNVNERIKIFFGEEYGLKIYSQPGMFTNIEIEIPIVKI